MERERWSELYCLITRLGKYYDSGWKYRTALIVAVYFWAVLHDRPVCWACDPANWPTDLLMIHLPSQDRMSRRLKTPAVQGLLAAVEAALRPPAASAVKAIDSKPLTVGICSKDHQARWGVVTDGKCLRGYKLHAIWDCGPLPLNWYVTSMNVQDGVGGRPLLQQLTGDGCLLGDGQYDQNTNYDLAAAHHHQLIALPRRSGAGRGHCRQSPHRLAGLELADEVCLWVRATRGQIERNFSGLTCFGGGLTCLPPWVRGLQRVTHWVQAKLVLNALRIHANARLLAMA